MKDLLNFTCVKPIKTVHTILEDYDALDLLRDDLVTIATKEIQSEDRSRREIQREIKSKERAIETLSIRYERKDLSQEKIRQCLYRFVLFILVFVEPDLTCLKVSVTIMLF